MKLEYFGCLPSLIELKLTCNSISDIGDIIGFGCLQRLDLSYNKVNMRSIQSLSFLPNLVELDLCGNNLKSLPRDMYRFHKLEKLLLEHNKMDDNEIFHTLSTIPYLRYVTLAYNFLWKISSTSCKGDAYRYLDTMDITYNYFGSEDDLRPLIDLTRLTTLLIYGNPLLGPTGEDPLKMYVEDIVFEATEIRLKEGKKELEILTQIPKKVRLIKGVPSGRKSSYKNVPLANIDEKLDKSGREWREEGNKTLFSEAVADARALRNSQSIADNSNTFLTAISNDDNTNNLVDLMAQRIMTKVADEMEIEKANTAELLLLRDKVTLKSVLAPNPMTSQSSTMIGDIVPHKLFTQELTENTQLETNPVDLRVAMRALKMAINNPLTNYNEIPGKGMLPRKGYFKQTAAQLNRAVPKHIDMRAALEEQKRKESMEHLQDLKTKPKGGLPEPTSLRRIRDANREETLQQIEDVLDSLNSRTSEIVKKIPGEGQNARSNIKDMQAFARPQKGLSSLLDMVNEVIQDLDS